MTQANTDEAEGAQAIFCYVADMRGLDRVHKEWPQFLVKRSRNDGLEDKFLADYGDIISKGYSSGRIKTTKSQSTIESFIRKQASWFRSSLLISQKLIEDVDEINKTHSKFNNIDRPGWQNFYYRHGDEEVMGVLTSLFSSANQDSTNTINPKTDRPYGRPIFGDLNKWSPADIYFATTVAKNALKKLNNSKARKGNFLTFTDLNETVTLLVESGDLLPLSLKKVKDHVKIVKVNFNRTVETKILNSTQCTGVEPWKQMQPTTPGRAYNIVTNRSFQWKERYQYKVAGGGDGGRDIYVKVESQKKKLVLHFRATPATKGRPLIGIKVILKYSGSSALAGQVASVGGLLRLIRSAGAYQFARDFESIWNTKNIQFKTAANAYIGYGKPISGKEYYEASKDGAKAKKLGMTQPEAKNKFNDDMGAINAITVMNPLRDLISNYFKSSDIIVPAQNGKAAVTEQDEVVRAIFQYTGSRMPDSARFVIAKD